MFTLIARLYHWYRGPYITFHYTRAELESELARMERDGEA